MTNKEEQMEGKQDMVDDLPTMKASKIIEPKDLGVKIGSPTQVLWTRVRDEAKNLIEQAKSNLIIQEAVLRLAERKITDEKNKA